MTHDELADAMERLLKEVHRHVDELTDQTLKAKAHRLAQLMHGAAEALRELAVDHNLIQPKSGGDPK